MLESKVDNVFACMSVLSIIMALFFISEEKRGLALILVNLCWIFIVLGYYKEKEKKNNSKKTSSKGI